MFWEDILGKRFEGDDRERASRELIEKCGYAAAALTIVPIPGSEIVAVMPIHVGMVVAIGHIFGHAVTKQSAMDMVLRIGTTVGMSLVGSRVATTAAKVLLPGLGGLLAAPFMYASTFAIGAVARAYFEAGGALSEAQMKSVYEEAKTQAKENFDPRRAKSEEAKEAASQAAQREAQQDPADRLAKLKKMLDQGLIEADEYERTKDRILSEL